MVGIDVEMTSEVTVGVELSKRAVMKEQEPGRVCLQ